MPSFAQFHKACRVNFWIWRRVGNGETQVIDYRCIYDDGSSVDPPLQATVQLDSKTVPHRFYGKDTGLPYDTVSDRAGKEVELPEFKYEMSDNLLRPNNRINYVICWEKFPNPLWYIWENIY